MKKLDLKNLPWTVPPPPKLRLEVVKLGKAIAEIPLTHSCTTFGRNPDMANIEIQHGSISRCHAAVMWGTPPGVRQAGVCIADLGSANGTFFGTVPDTSKLVRLKPNMPCSIAEGSCIRFGESTRLYIVRGSNSYRSAHDHKIRKRKHDSGSSKPKLWAEGAEAASQKATEWSHMSTESGMSADRQQKFLKLLGAKKRNRSAGGDMKPKKSQPDHKKMNQELERAFHTGLHTNRSRRGLG